MADPVVDLPPELIDYILGFVGGKALLACAQVCRPCSLTCCSVVDGTSPFG